MTTTSPWWPPSPIPSAAPREAKKAEDEPELDADGNPIAKDDDDDEDDQANMSLAAMEAALKPRVLETLDRIAEDYASCPRCRTAHLGHAERGRLLLEEGREPIYQKLRSEIVELVNELHLHNNRIEALIDQLYGINRRIMSIDSGMVKLADQARINRREFIEEYRGYELTRPGSTAWPRKPGRGWQAFMERSATRSRSCAPTWRRSASMSASTSPNSAAS
jgi:RNA polymerase primary sigma factor